MQFILSQLTFGHQGMPLTAPLHCHLERGNVVAVIGRNGSGKSTLLRTLAGLLRPLAGQVMIKHCSPLVANHSLATSAPRVPQQSAEPPLALTQHQPTASKLDTETLVDVHQLSPPERARWVSIVLPTATEVPPLTVEEVVTLGRLPHSTPSWRPLETDALVEDALVQCGLTDLRQRKVHQLSDGQRQRVMVARALAQHTPIVLLDEPTNFLDYVATEEMFTLLDALAHEHHKLIIAATHHLEWARRQDCLLEIE